MAQVLFQVSVVEGFGLGLVQLDGGRNSLTQTNVTWVVGGAEIKCKSLLSELDLYSTASLHIPHELNNLCMQVDSQLRNTEVTVVVKTAANSLKIYLELQVPSASAAIDSFDQRLPHCMDLIKVVHLQTHNRF